MRKSVTAPQAPAAVGPYEHATVADGFIYTSGQIHLDEDGVLIEGFPDELTHQVMKNLGAVLEAAGATYDDVVKSTVYVTDIATFSKVNEAYSSYFKQPYPAREVVGVQALPMGAKIEISVVAKKET